MIIASSGGPLNILINTNFASSIGTGAASWMYYAFRILHLPVGLFGVAIGVVALPALTRAVVANEGLVNRRVLEKLEPALGLIYMLMAMCTVFYVVNDRDLIAIFFQQGQFTSNDAVETAKALFGYSFIVSLRFYQSDDGILLCCRENQATHDGLLF